MLARPLVGFFCRLANIKSLMFAKSPLALSFPVLPKKPIACSGKSFHLSQTSIEIGCTKAGAITVVA
jgi:hypothetical protein